jgi:hypothetical protein
MSLFDDATLCTDDDLTQWESKMPALAERTNVYAGKRQLAKNFLGKQLIKRGVNTDEIADPTQLKDAAVFKELELMFRDLSDKSDSIAAQKACYYGDMFDDELEVIFLKLSTGEAAAPTISSIPLYRA